MGRMSGPGNQERILLFLRRHGEASVGELGRGLALTQVTVRHHLQELIRSGFVSLPERRHRGGPGRPAQVYSLTPQAVPLLPGNLPELARALVGTLEARHGPEWLRKALLASGSRAAAGIPLASAPGSEGFVSEVLAALDERGYLAAAGRWSGRRCITFSNCPYQETVRLTPAVCAFDQALMEGLLQEPVVLFHRLADHDDHCMFLLGA